MEKDRTYIDWKKYPVRTCNISHYCFICSENVRYGDEYYDGSYGKRAHKECVEKEFADD